MKALNERLFAMRANLNSATKAEDPVKRPIRPGSVEYPSDVDHQSTPGTAQSREHRRHILNDVASVYGVQMANYIVPLATVPYLSRVLGPETWGLVAIAQAFALYGHLVVEYGFVLSATREIAQTSSPAEISTIIAGVTGARLLLSGLVLAAVAFGSQAIPLLRTNPLLLWVAVLSELLKASLPNYYFYGIGQVRTASILDISARVASLLGIFLVVQRPEHAWRFFALQGAGALVALVLAHRWMGARHRMGVIRWPNACRKLRDGFGMFLFRSSHNLYTLGNAFVLGLFAPASAVGFYAGAEKLNGAAVGLLSPLSTALYPRSVNLTKREKEKGARLTVMSFYAVLTAALGLAVVMWFGAPILVRLILGRQYTQAAGVLQILALRAPLVAATNVLGFQWLLALGLEIPFQRITVVALLLNLLLAAVLAPTFMAIGMAWAVVVSQSIVVAGIFAVLQHRALNPFAMRSHAEPANH